VRRADGPGARQRGLLARLIGVVAVVAGLVVLVAPLCVDGMSTMPSDVASSSAAAMTVPSTSASMLEVSGDACAVVPVPAETHDCVLPSMGFAPGTSLPGPHGAVLACVVLLLAVLAGVLGLAARRGSWVAVPGRPVVLGLPVRPPRGPALPELCVLRI
jgi:hypothetical protein